MNMKIMKAVCLLAAFAMVLSMVGGLIYIFVS